MSEPLRSDPNGLRTVAEHSAAAADKNCGEFFDPRWVPHLPSNPVPRGSEAGEYACLFNLLRDPRFQRIKAECPSPANILAAETDSCAISYLTDLVDFLEQAAQFAGEEAPIALDTARDHTRAVLDLLRARVSEIYMRVVFKDHPEAFTAFDQTRRGFGPGVDLEDSIKAVAGDIIKEKIKRAVKGSASVAGRGSQNRTHNTGRGLQAGRGRGGRGRGRGLGRGDGASSSLAES